MCLRLRRRGRVTRGRALRTMRPARRRLPPEQAPCSHARRPVAVARCVARALAERLNVSLHTVHRVLRQTGVVTRPVGTNQSSCWIVPLGDAWSGRSDLNGHPPRPRTPRRDVDLNRRATPLGDTGNALPRNRQRPTAEPVRFHPPRADRPLRGARRRGARRTWAPPQCSLYHRVSVAGRAAMVADGTSRHCTRSGKSSRPIDDRSCSGVLRSSCTRDAS